MDYYLKILIYPIAKTSKRHKIYSFTLLVYDSLSKEISIFSLNNRSLNILNIMINLKNHTNLIKNKKKYDAIRHIINFLQLK